MKKFSRSQAVMFT